MLRRSGEPAKGPGLAVGCVAQCALVVSSGTSPQGASCDHLAGQPSFRQALSILGLGLLCCRLLSFSFLILRIEWQVSCVLSKPSASEPCPSLLHVTNSNELPQPPRIIVIAMRMCLRLAGVPGDRKKREGTGVFLVLLWNPLCLRQSGRFLVWC